MKLPPVFSRTAMLLICLVAASAAHILQAADKPAEKIKLLVMTGGHGFQPESFFKLFQDNPEITYTSAVENKSAEAWDRDDLLNFDVVLLYDFQRELSEAQQAKFHLLLDHGVGLIVLHHALLSYQNWPEYERVAGGKYLLDNERTEAGVTPASTYEGNVDIDLSVVAKDHPIAAGLHDFKMHDEIYRGVRTTKDIAPLLVAEGKPAAWTRAEKKSRVFTTILGHGAYSDPNFQRLLAQAIHWTAGRD